MLLQLRKDITLLYQLTKANIKLQNENSILGILWYILGPLFLFAILLFVFANRLGEGVDHYPLYLMIGIIAWNFFITASTRCMTTLSSNALLIKALPISLEILIISTVLYTFITHLLELLLFALLMYWYQVMPGHMVLYIFILAIGSIFTMGMGFFLSSIYVLLRDVQQVWSVITRAWWFATPIFYVPTPNGPGVFFSQFNPMYYMVHFPRELLIYDRIPPMHQWIIFIGFAAVTFFIGYATFLHTRPHFVERL